jgi:hypothetical protein
VFVVTTGYGGAASGSFCADHLEGRRHTRHLLLVGLVAAFAVSLASVAVSAAATETPFKRTVNAVETGTVVFPTRFLDREGTGTATHLGRYAEHVTMVINIPTLSSTGTATFTAANGDTLLATVAGQATRTSPTTLSILEDYTITGGTGRFADATGSFTLNSTLDQVTGVSSARSAEPSTTDAHRPDRPERRFGAWRGRTSVRRAVLGRLLRRPLRRQRLTASDPRDGEELAAR